MLFKGTTARPTGFIDRDVEGVGGRMNAGTSLDYTYYHMVLPAPRALAGIETLADISVNASLDAQALDEDVGHRDHDADRRVSRDQSDHRAD